jgi:predicted dehydrogenase
MNRISRRKFLEQSLLAAATAATSQAVLPGFALASAPRKVGPNDRIRIGVIGVRGRGRAHIGAFKKSPDSEVVAICDPDEAVIGPAHKALPDAKYYKDMRQLFDDPSIDAVSIATPNHWHSLATIWALQAGKHVYVEKPISHDIFEGRQVIRAAQKSGLLVQHGTQARSATATRDAIAWMQAGGLGKVFLAHGLCYKRRKSIGKVAGPQKPPASVDYDLWTGPAAMQPLMRQSLHYDWHWLYNTGNGDVGNQGVHQMDIARWGLNQSSLPTSVISCGGRVGYDDDGDTPNSLLTHFDYGDQSIVFEVRGLKTGPERDTNIGVIFHGEKGYLVSASYGKLHAYDREGQVIETFEGEADHFQHFLDVLKSGDHGQCRASVQDAHLSAVLCHMANIAYRVGGEAGLNGWRAQPSVKFYTQFCGHLREQQIDLQSKNLHVSPQLSFDPVTERFTGEHAAAANQLLRKPSRKGFEIPDLA